MQIINIIKLKNISHLVVYFIFLTFSLLGDTQNIVKNIYVELDLEGNTDYRKKAIDISYKVALVRYLNWITIKDKQDIYNLISPLVHKDYISGYSIESEKYTKSKYSAFISVNFNIEKIDTLLKSYNIKYFAKKGPKTLLIPVMEFNDKVILWDDPNPWFDTWYKRPLDANLTNFILPTGEVDDLITLSAEDAIKLSYYKIKKLGIKYNAEDVLILVVKLKQNNDDYSYEYLAYNGLNQTELFVKNNENIDIKRFNQSLLDLANIFAEYYDDEWVKKNLDRNNLNTKIFVEAHFEKLTDWIRIKNFFLNNDNVNTFIPKNLSNKTALLELKIISEDLIIEDLEKNNYEVVKNQEKLIIKIQDSN